MHALKHLLLFSLLISTSLFQLKAQTDCSVLWSDVVYGTCNGRGNSFVPYDYGADGSIELFVNAGSNSGYWFLLKYNPLEQDYNIIKSSLLFDDIIYKLSLLDLDGSGSPTLVFGVGNDLHLVDPSTLETLSIIDLSSTLSSWADMSQLIMVDADNDGEDELVIGTNGELVLLNPVTFETEFIYETNAHDLGVGNVDDDPNVEIVLAHGIVLEFVGNTLVEEIDFKPNVDENYDLVELSDIDNDGKMEAIVGTVWNDLTAYDVESANEIYTIDVVANLAALQAIDIDGDGMDEIFYGDYQWGYLYCHNGSNGQLLWEIETDAHVSGIFVEDVDGDSFKEIGWGSGCFSGAEDAIFIHDLASLSFEWKSLDVNGPFYIVEVNDVDEDGVSEIITLTREATDNGDVAYLTVYNAISKEMEFRSDEWYSGALFNSIYSDFHNLEIYDYNDDGDLDIVIAGGQVYHGIIWVLDGNTYNLESYHHYDSFTNEALDPFINLAIDDVDSDGISEYILTGDDGVTIINSHDYSVEWQDNDFLPGVKVFKGILTGDVDSDTDNEIILCYTDIYKYEFGSLTKTINNENEYTSIVLYDWTSDGNQEIIAGTEDGKIVILEGENLEIITSFSVTDETISGVSVGDLNGDDQDEIVATSEDQIFFVSFEGVFVSSQILADDLGEYQGLEFQDYNNDGIDNILVGSIYGILEIGPTCVNCLSVEVSLDIVNPTCSQEFGSFAVSSPDTTVSFFLEGLEVDSIINGLTSGYYELIIEDGQGCSSRLGITLEELPLEIEAESTNLSCTGLDDGTASVSIYQGLPPFSYLWSEGDTTSMIDSLSTGVYNVTVTDANGCVDSDNVFLTQTNFNTWASVDFDACEGQNNGVASVAINSGGTPPYEIYWNGIIGPETQDSLAVGTYNITIVDSVGCVSEEVVEIEEVNISIDYNLVIHSCGGDGGFASVFSSGGSSPVNHLWNTGATNNPGSTYSFITDVGPGWYAVSVTDAHGCSSVDSVEILGSNLNLEITAMDVLCHGQMNGQATVLVDGGIPPYGYMWSNGEVSETISGIGPGNYSVEIIDSIGCEGTQNTVVFSPSLLNVDLSIVNDNGSTSVFEGGAEAIVTGGTAPYSYDWSNGDTTATINNLAPGDYSLTVSDANDCGTTVIFSIETTTSANELSNGELKVYPNPTSSSILIEITDPNLAFSEIALLNALGQPVRIFKRKELPLKRIDLSDFSDGIYFLRFTEHEKNLMVYRKLMKVGN